MRFSFIFTSFLLVSSHSALAAEMPQNYARLMQELVPDEFKSLLVLRPMTAEFVLVNGNTLSVTAALSNYAVRLGDPTSVTRLQAFLLANHVSSEGVTQVMTALRAGKESAPDCKGDKARCDVVVGDKTFSVVVDRPSRRVRLLLAPTLFAGGAEVAKYYTSYNNNPALINSVSLFSSRYDSDVWTSLNDRVLLGLPYGHVNSVLYANTSANNHDISLDVDKLEYNLDMGGYRFMAGRSRDFNAQNTTRLLNISSQQKEGAYLMSSRNLLRGKSNAYQRVYFYMPSLGAVEVYRDGQLLFSRALEAGQQFISYDQLPVGTYPLTLKLKSGDNEISERVVNISNNPSISLPTGQLDFTLGASHLINGDDRLFNAEGAVAFRPVDNWQLASGVTLSENHQLFSAGAAWALSDELNLDGTVGLFSDGARYAQLNLGWANVRLGYQVLRGADDNQAVAPGQKPTTGRTLSTMLLGENTDYQQASLSVSYPLGELTAYSSVFYYGSNIHTSHNNYQSLNANAGLSMPFFFNSTLGLNLGAVRSLSTPGSGVESVGRDITVGLNWTLPLGEQSQAIASLQTSRHGQDTFYGAVRRQFKPMDNLSASLEAGTRYRRQQVSHEPMEASVSGMLNYKGSAFRTSASGTLNEHAGDSAYLSLDGSQVISSEGVFFTSDPSDSYLLVHDSGSGGLAEQAGRIVLGDESQFSGGRDYYPTNSPLLTPLEHYQYYNVKLQSDNGLIHNRGDQDLRGFVFPGSLLNMETRFEKEYQLLGAFYFADGSPVAELSCEGEACVQVDKLDEGLFKIRLSGDGGYRLLAGAQLCLDDRRVDTSSVLTRLPRVECLPPPHREHSPVLLGRRH